MSSFHAPTNHPFAFSQRQQERSYSSSFNLIPSGVTPDKFENLKAIRLDCRTSKEPILEREDGSVEVQADQEIYLITQSQGKAQAGEIDLNPFNQGSYFEGSLVRALATFPDLKGKALIPRDSSVFTTIDCGAYQEMSRGLTIKTEEFGTYIQSNGHEAFIHDPIPLGLDFYYPDKMEALAKEQRRRTNLLKACVRGQEIRLVNVIHGRNYQEQRRWLDLVWDDDLSHISIGSDAKSLISNLPMIAHLVFERQVERLHFLGINGEIRVLLHALLSSYVPVTVDGSQAVEHSFERRVFWSLLPEGRLRETAVGSPKSEATLATLGGLARCTCMACKLVPHLEAYRLQSTVLLPILFLHNQAMQQEFVRQWVAWMNKDEDQTLRQAKQVFAGQPSTSNYARRMQMHRNFQAIRHFMRIAKQRGLSAASSALASVL